MYWSAYAELRAIASKARLAAVAALAAASLAAGLAAYPAAVSAKQSPGELPTVTLSELPAEARTTYELIHAGGPFPYQKDGTVFMNRERLLPQQSRGFYREYTVKTPRSRDRGARRIVCGGKPPTTPEACYYTADHYASFRRIAKP